MAKTTRKIKILYLVDANGKCEGVCLDIKDYKRILAELNELRSRQTNRVTKKSSKAIVPKN